MATSRGGGVSLLLLLWRLILLGGSLVDGDAIHGGRSSGGGVGGGCRERGVRGGGRSSLHIVFVVVAVVAAVARLNHTDRGLQSGRQVGCCRLRRGNVASRAHEGSGRQGLSWDIERGTDVHPSTSEEHGPSDTSATGW